MPAETHTHRDSLDAHAILELMAALVGADPDTAATTELASIDLDDEQGALHLWAAVVEEFGERSLGEFEPPDPLPVTLGELAQAFHAAIAS